MQVMEAISTAPAAMSLISFISGRFSVDIKSMVFSMQVLNISAKTIQSQWRILSSSIRAVIYERRKKDAMMTASSRGQMYPFALYSVIIKSLIPLNAYLKLFICRMMENFSCCII